MKKSLLFAILGLATSVSSSFAQGYITLDNYNTYGPYITYGPTGGGTVGTGINTTFKVGLYFGQGAFAGSVAADPTPYGNGIPTSLQPSLLLGTGTGSTATAGFFTFGSYFSGNAFQASATAGTTITAMVVAYNGTDYASSSIRGHSAAFQMIAKGATDLPPAVTGAFHSAFQVNQIPEPSIMALAGLGLVSMLVARRRGK